MTGWRHDETVDLDAENADLVDGKPTAMVMIHHPENLDEHHRTKVTPKLMLDGFRSARPIFAEAGVQLELAAVRTGPLDPALFEITSTDDPHPMPRGRFVGMYRGIERLPHRLSS